MIMKLDCNNYNLVTMLKNDKSIHAREYRFCMSKKSLNYKMNRNMTMTGKKIEDLKGRVYHTSKGEYLEESEQDLQKQWSSVIFYPADFTFVCPTELGDHQKQYAKLPEFGVEVYSVSTDTHF